MKISNLAFALSGALIVAGCAKKPETIQAAYVPTFGYEGLSCQQLSEEEVRLAAAYNQVADQQNQARQNDTMGVIFLGLPVSSLSGDNVAGQVAQVKGQQEAVRQTLLKKGC